MIIYWQKESNFLHGILNRKTNHKSIQPIKNVQNYVIKPAHKNFLNCMNILDDWKRVNIYFAKEALVNFRIDSSFYGFHYLWYVIQYFQIV